jgi:4-amino-4-deoxy-L-arabinose transferase-like glycosyltransferase
MGHLRGIILLIALSASLFIYGLADTDLWSAHEARAAQNAQRMVDDRSWGLPQLYDGQVDLQKPPVFYWLVAGVATLNDGVVNRWAVRLPAAMAGLLTVVMVYFFLAGRGRPEAALIAAAVLATSIHFVSSARTGRIDMPLTCVITTALLLLVSDQSRALKSLGAGILLGSAILLKGPIGLALPLSALMSVRLLQRWSHLPIEVCKRAPLLVVSGIAMLVAAPWFFWANRETNGELFRVFFWHHNIERALGDSPTLAVHPWWYYGPRFALDFLPWTPLLLFAVVLFVRNRSWRSDATASFGLVWSAIMIGVLSCSGFKRADYLLPAYPGAAVFVGCILESRRRELAGRWRRIATVGFGIVLAGCLTGWLWFHHHIEPGQEAAHQQGAFAHHIRQLTPSPAPVLLFRVEAHLLAFHLGRPVHTLVEWDELNERLAAPGIHYFVTRAEFTAECLANVRSRQLEIAARSQDFSRAALLRPLVLFRTVDNAHAPSTHDPIACRNNPPKD